MERLNTSKKNKRASQKNKKKANIVMEQSSLPLPQIQLKMIERNVYFLYET